jgi:hypothetical protein
MHIKCHLSKIALLKATAFALATVSFLATDMAGSALAQTTSANPNALVLLDKYAALSESLARNPYGRPLVLESVESAKMVSGDAYAVLSAPFTVVSSTLKRPSRWCDVMILHINTKYCRATADNSPSLLNVYIGKKVPQDLDDTFPLEFTFQLASATPNFLMVQLNADKGPLGTSDYRIELRALPLPDEKTFLHLHYSYGYGLAGRLAMQAYLATLGREKVGFTQIKDGAKNRYVGGMRGAVERNTMRYYLAIDAYLACLSQPSANEQYPEQLHDTDKKSYLNMKKAEYLRQQAG